MARKRKSGPKPVEPRLASKEPGKVFEDAGVITDPRFSSVHFDPRFTPIQKKRLKVKIDKRFRNHLNDDEEFQSGPPIDKYGRPLAESKKETLERFYNLEDTESDEDEHADAPEKQHNLKNQKRTGKTVVKNENSVVDPDNSQEKDKVLTPGSLKSKKNLSKEVDSKILKKDTVLSASDGISSDLDSDDLRFQRARGNALSDSSETESDEELVVEELNSSDVGSDEEFTLGNHEPEDDDEEEFFDEVLDRKEIPLGDATLRFAAVNMDWDYIKACDLFQVFDSLKPAGGTIVSVTIYPSEFGIERMEHEQQFGPKLLGFENVSGDEEDEAKNDSDDGSVLKDDDGKDYNSAVLRRYQLERLRYFYAVVECDSVETARHVFKECDGAEYEATSNFFDLRFIPEDVTFDETPRDAATCVPVTYRPSTFETKALQHTDVKLTWDEDDPDRLEVTRKKLSYKELKEMDFKAYIASDSDSDAKQEDSENIKKYRSLLGLGDEKPNASVSSDDEEVRDLEVTFTPGLSEATEKLIQERDERLRKSNETTIEKYQRKERERKLKRKQKFKEAENENDDTNEVGNDDEVGFDDPFFAEDIDMEDAEEMEMAGESSGEKEKSKKLSKKERQEKRNRRKQMIAEDLAEQQEEEGDFAVNLADDRFQSVFDESEFAIDPTNPHFKPTEGMQKILHEKRNRGSSKPIASKVPTPNTQSLSSLVDSVKRKASDALKGMDSHLGRRKKPKA
jgi:hypothetical protein